MSEVSDQEFEAILATAYDGIPAAVRGRLERLAVLVADEPSESQLAEFAGEGTLFGLFEGVVRGEEHGAIGSLPPVITIFRKPLLAWCRTREELEQEVRDTLWHEVAHYLGYDEEMVRHEEAASDRLRGR